MISKSLRGGYDHQPLPQALLTVLILVLMLWITEEILPMPFYASSPTIEGQIPKGSQIIWPNRYLLWKNAFNGRRKIKNECYENNPDGHNQ